MSLNLNWNFAALTHTADNGKNFTRFIQMNWKSRNQNNVIPFNKAVENKKLIDAEIRLRKLMKSIEWKMQQPMWEMLLFDDDELEILSSFGETLKFANEQTAPKVASVLATYLLRKQSEEDLTL